MYSCLESERDVRHRRFIYVRTGLWLLVVYVSGNKPPRLARTKGGRRDAGGTTTEQPQPPDRTHQLLANGSCEPNAKGRRTGARAGNGFPPSRPPVFIAHTLVPVVQPAECHLAAFLPQTVEEGQGVHVVGAVSVALRDDSLSGWR